MIEKKDLVKTQRTNRKLFMSKIDRLLEELTMFNYGITTPDFNIILDHLKQARYTMERIK